MGAVSHFDVDAAVAGYRRCAEETHAALDAAARQQRERLERRRAGRRQKEQAEAAKAAGLSRTDLNTETLIPQRKDSRSYTLNTKSKTLDP